MKRVLIVEDDGPIRRSVRKVLSKRFGEGSCDEAADGREAVEKMRESRYSAVLSDVHMPEMGGLEMLELSLREGLCGIRSFVFICGMPESPEFKEIAGMGASIFVKPVPVEELMSLVAAAMGSDG